MKNKGTIMGTSRYWWLLLVLGILLIVGGLGYWLWPAAGYATAAMLFGWLLLGAGVVQVCVAAERNHPRGWGWWLVGGIIDIFIGCMLVSNIFLAEAVLPWFLAFIFAYWGFMAMFRSFNGGTGWGIYLINGILLLIISGFFMYGGYQRQEIMVSLITSLAFIYWGFSVSAVAYDMRPAR